MRQLNIAVLAGDGIGTEVMPGAIRTLEAATRNLDVELRFEHHDFASADYYSRTGRMMPADWSRRLGSADAIFFGAVGWPDVVPDHVSLWDSLLTIRREFDQYINLRPVRLLAGVRSPLADRQPGDIDFYVVRENTEGEYSDIGGKAYAGTDREVVLQQTIMSRYGVDRVIRFAFELARRRSGHLTSATKSNGLAISMPYWDSRVEAIAPDFPDVPFEKSHIDALAAGFVLRPQRYDVVVGSNLFGDILSDLGPACTGTIGVAPSANLNPERRFPSLFEPVHGSAPDIAGKGIANPVGQIWSGAMMLEHLGLPEAAAAIVHAIEAVLRDGPATSPLTPDLGGTATTHELADAIAASIHHHAEEQ